MNLDQFISSPKLRNSWIKEKHISIYVRRSTRLIGTNVYPFLDLASVEVKESQRGNGIFTSFLHRFENEAKKIGCGVFIESILNTRLQTYLLTKEYLLVPHTNDLSLSMYKMT